MKHADPEDCPLCGGSFTDDADRDRALVVAFLGGVATHMHGMPIGQALCAKHAPMAAEAVAFVIRNFGERIS